MRGKCIDLTGQKFGKLTVIERDYSKTGGAAFWKCECECGGTRVVRSDRLKNGEVISCGCVVRKPAVHIDTTSLIGQVIGRLTVLERDLSVPIGHGCEAKWICQCECGNKTSVTSNNLIHQKTRSCGCLQKDTLIKRQTLDLTNKRYGKLVAKENTFELSPHHSYLWKCVCDCGNEVLVSAENLQRGQSKSCGCTFISSHGEEKITQILIDNNICFNIQQTFPDLRGTNKQFLRYDFAILNDEGKIVRLIEFDGEQHYNPNSRYYSKRGVELDQLKNDYAKKHNYPLVRIPYKELNKLNLELLLGDTYLLC